MWMVLKLLLLSSRLPQRTLALLGLYAWAIVQVTERGWVSRDVLGKGGAAIVGALSMGKALPQAKGTS